MKTSKRLQALAFSFIALNVVEKAVLLIFLIMVDYVKNDLLNRQQIPSNRALPRKIMETLKRSIFSFTIVNLVNKGILLFSYYCRHVTRGRRGRGPYFTFLKIGRKCSDFGKKCLDFDHLYVEFLI